MNICCCGWVTTEADWPIVRQGEVRWENQTKDTGKKKRGVREVTSETL